MRPTRRAVLLGSAAGVLSACSFGDTPKAPKPARVNPDVALRAAAVSREQALLAAYDAAALSVAPSPAAVRLLASVRAEHAAHLEALTRKTTSPTPSAPSPLGARGLAATLRSLSAQERAAAAAHAAAVVTASRALAPILASLAASESSHVVVL